MNKLVALAGALILVAAWSTVSAADEVKAPVSPSMLLSISSPLSETRDAAFDRAMKEPGPAAGRRDPA